uniref:Uncharacterized protein n=1 Tax=Eutreptiella gymnastica TaxID=73025 RepID=A0A7S4G1K7_9EUGL
MCCFVQRIASPDSNFGLQPERSSLDYTSLKPTVLELCRLKRWIVAGMGVGYMRRDANGDGGADIHLSMHLPMRAGIAHKRTDANTLPHSQSIWKAIGIQQN